MLLTEVKIPLITKGVIELVKHGELVYRIAKLENIVNIICIVMNQIIY